MTVKSESQPLLGKKLKTGRPLVLKQVTWILLTVDLKQKFSTGS